MRKPTHANLYRPLLMAILFMIGSIFISYSQCPTVINPTQSFCDVQAPIIANLTATDNGNGIRWYATSISTTPLANGLGLVNGEDYYADDNSGSCGTRQRVDVIIYGPPMALSFQGVCVDNPNDATIADLIATGNNIQWYTSPSGGTPLATSTILIDNTIYYVNQSNPDTGCRTSRLQVFVNVGVVPVPIGDPIQEFCSDAQPPPTVADLQASGNNNWYSTISSATPLDASTPLVNGQSYFATTIDPPCESIERLEVLVVFTNPPNPGTSGNIAICETDVISTGSVNLFDALGGTADTTGTWAGPLPTSNGNLGTVNVTTLSVAGSPYVFTYSVDSEACGISESSVTITIVPPPDAGSDGFIEFCENDAPQNLFGSLNGTPQPGGSWMPALASGTGVFDPSVDAPGFYTYTVNGTSPCGTDTAQVEVEINPIPEPGTSGNIAICETDVISTGSVNLFDALGGTPDTTGTWSGPLPTTNGNLGTVNVTTLTVAGSPYVFTYTVDSDTCEPGASTVTITIVPPPDAGSDGFVEFCENEAPEDLFNSLNGTPQPGGSWSPTLSSGNGVFDPALDAPGIYTYTVNGISPCGIDTAQVEVQVNPIPEPGTSGNIAICETDVISTGSVNLFDALGGTPDNTGTWSGPLPTTNGNMGTVNVTTLTVAGSPYVFIYTVDSDTCEPVTSTVTITIVLPPDAGSDGFLEFCENDAPQDLFGSLNGTPQPGGSWMPALASGTGVFNPAVDASGFYNYTVNGISPCGTDTAQVEVQVNPVPEPGTSGNIAICETDVISTGSVNLFDALGGTPDNTGTWSGPLPTTNGNLGTVNVTTLTVAGSPYVFTYTVDSDTCDPSSSTVTITILPPPDAGSNGTLILCENSNPVDLFDSLLGTPDIGGTWSPPLASGTGIFDPSIDPAGDYMYSVGGTPTSCGTATATVTVIINPLPDPGTNSSITLCENDPPIDLLTVLGGTPDSGGQWSPPLSSGTGVFNPAIDTSGTYTYLVIGISPCGGAFADVTVTVNPQVDAGNDGILNLCETDTNLYSLFDSLGGTPDPNGSWTPALSGGSGIFNPAVDSPGIYTYTVLGTNSCGDDSANVTVNIDPVPNPGSTGSLSICENDTSLYNLFNSLTGTPDPGGVWSPSLVSGTGIFDPSVDAFTTYTYTVGISSPCGSSSSSVTVILALIPDAGTSVPITLCDTNAPVNLFDSLGGNPDVGGTWSPTLASGTGIFDPAIDAPGTYTYELSGPAFCGIDTATVDVTVNESPNVSGLILTVESICLGLPSLVTISGATQLDNGQYSLTYTLSGANNSQTTIVLIIGNGGADFNIPVSLLTNPGITTFTLTGLSNNTTSCGASLGGISPVTFTVIQDPTPQLISGGDQFCSEDNPTIADLSANIIGTIPVIWYDAFENGNPYTDTTLLVDGTTYYAESVVAGGCDNGIRLTVTITIASCEVLELIIPDGFSPNGDNINDDFDIVNIRDLYPNFYLQIYNRYGNILYEGNTNTPNWDGTSDKGREFGSGLLPVGVYFYILELRDSTNRTIQGRVYLSR